MRDQADLFGASGGVCTGQSEAGCRNSPGLMCLCRLTAGHEERHRCKNCGWTFTTNTQAVRELALRDATLEHLSHLREQYLDEIRAEMVMLYDERHREYGGRAFVTADDVRNYFESLPNVPTAKVLNRNFLGSVFKVSDWEAVGMRHSRTEGRHGNRVFKWIHNASTS